jgi:hypothetical protein
MVFRLVEASNCHYAGQKWKKAGKPAFFIQAKANYLEAAGAAAAAEAEASAFSAFLAFLAFLTFLAFGAGVEASAEAAGAEAAGASAAKAETANRPATKAAIRFFIFVVFQLTC